MPILPGVRIIVASDAIETKWMVKTAIEPPEPMYIRLSRQAIPGCHRPDAKLGATKKEKVAERK